MSVPLSWFQTEELLVTDKDQFEFSEAARYATTVVGLFLANDSAELAKRARQEASQGPETLARWFIGRMQAVDRYNPSDAGWRSIGAELSVSDFTRGRIHWHDVCEELLVK